MNNEKTFHNKRGSDLFWFLLEGIKVSSEASSSKFCLQSPRDGALIIARNDTGWIENIREKTFLKTAYVCDSNEEVCY